MKDVWISIAILMVCCIALGFGLAEWRHATGRRKQQEAYYAECERDFYREPKYDPPELPF